MNLTKEQAAEKAKEADEKTDLRGQHFVLMRLGPKGVFNYGRQLGYVSLNALVFFDKNSRPRKEVFLQFFKYLEDPLNQRLTCAISQNDLRDFVMHLDRFFPIPQQKSRGLKSKITIKNKYLWRKFGKNLTAHLSKRRKVSNPLAGLKPRQAKEVQ